MLRDFNKWIKTLRSSIADFSYYVDFEKIYQNVDSIKLELGIWNALIGSKNIEQEFETMINKYPSTLKCIPMLLAVRSKEILIAQKNKVFNYNFDKLNYSIDEYKLFMEKTGLFELLSNHLISSVIDYVTGVETGLDSNARKNRGGDLMENIIESYIKGCNFVIDKDYFRQMLSMQIEERWNIDLSSITGKGISKKKFDFVIYHNNKIFLIETNFYASSGSKLNEVARSYKKLYEGIKGIPNVYFIWFTDGQGWLKARHNLEETFNVMEDIYNLKDLESGILDKLLQR